MWIDFALFLFCFVLYQIHKYTYCTQIFEELYWTNSMTSQSEESFVAISNVEHQILLGSKSKSKLTKQLTTVKLNKLPVVGNKASKNTELTLAKMTTNSFNTLDDTENKNHKYVE